MFLWKRAYKCGSAACRSVSSAAVTERSRNKTATCQVYYFYISSHIPNVKWIKLFFSFLLSIFTWRKLRCEMWCGNKGNESLSFLKLSGVFLYFSDWHSTADADFYLILFVLYAELHPLCQAEAAPQKKASLTFQPPRFQPIASIVGASLLWFITHPPPPPKKGWKNPP